ncbi:MAG TPA: dihydrofolate reductase family protein [Solirubrobacteraceae bacterium]
MRRLHPDPAEVSAAEALAEVDFAALAPDDRPYLILNMVASADGRATLEGKTAQLSSEADKEMFHTLRRQVDGVLVGTGTLREERYGPLIRDGDEQPVAIVCSRTGEFPEDIGLFTDPRSRVFRYTGPSPGEALRRAQAECGVRSVLCEGGPTLNGALLGEGVVDELFLTISPLLADRPAPLTIVEAAGLDEPVSLELVWVLEAEGMLFLRYALVR